MNNCMQMGNPNNPNASNYNNPDSNPYFMNGGFNGMLASQQQQLYQQQQQQYELQQNLKRMPIHNLTEVFLSRKESMWNEDKLNNPNKAVKRSNFHVGLAYHIHLLEREKKTK